MVKLRVKGTGAGPAAAVGQGEKRPRPESVVSSIVHGLQLWPHREAGDAGVCVLHKEPEMVPAQELVGYLILHNRLGSMSSKPARTKLTMFLSSCLKHSLDSQLSATPSLPALHAP